MAIVKAKPTSPGRRGLISVKSDLYKGKPHKSLLEPISKNGGRIINGSFTAVSYTHLTLPRKRIV